MNLRWKNCNLPTKMIWLQLTTSTKYQRMNTQPLEMKTTHSQIKMHNKHLKNITKIDKYEKN